MTVARVPGVPFLIAGHGQSAMPPSLSFLTVRWPAKDTAARLGYLRIALIGALHLTAIALMDFHEGDLLENTVFALTWGFLNFFWIVVLRRPLVSAALSLAMIAMIMLVSDLKYNIVWMTANFLDVWIINANSIHYLLSIKPDLIREAIIAVAVFFIVIGLFWWIDHFRIGRSIALAGFAACFVAVSSISLAFPMLEWEAFVGNAHVSKFVRSGIVAVSELLQHGYIDAGQSITERLKTVPNATCTPASKPPHIILVHDESSFDIRGPRRVSGCRRGMAGISSRSTASAPLPRRGDRRAELVHRIQRAVRVVRALVRAACLLRDPHRGRARRARTAAVRCAAAATAHSRSIRRRAPS